MRALLALLACQLPSHVEDEITERLQSLLRNWDPAVTLDVRLNATLSLLKLASRKRTLDDILEEV